MNHEPDLITGPDADFADRLAGRGIDDEEVKLAVVGVGSHGCDPVLGVKEGFVGRC